MPFRRTLPQHFEFVDLTSRAKEYAYRPMSEQWMLIVGEAGKRLPPKLRNLAKRAYDHAPTSLWACDDVALRRKVGFLTASILTGVWFSISFAERETTTEEVKTVMRRCMLQLSRNLGKHLRYVLVLDRGRDDVLHAHVVVEVDWMVAREHGRVPIFSLLVPLLPDGIVDMAPYVTGGGAFEYQAGHTFGLKASGRSIAVVEEHVACGRRGERCESTKCDASFWDQAFFARIDRYDRSAIPLPVRGTVTHGTWAPKIIKLWAPRPPKAQSDLQGHRNRDRAVSAILATSAAESGGPRRSARLPSEIAVRRGRKELRASGVLPPSPKKADKPRSSVTPPD